MLYHINDVQDDTQRVSLSVGDMIVYNCGLIYDVVSGLDGFFVFGKTFCGLRYMHTGVILISDGRGYRKMGVVA